MSAGRTTVFHVLALNSGSSSLKVGLYGVQASATEMLLEEAAPSMSAADAIKHIVGMLSRGKLPAPEGIGHRIVHGGPRLRRHCVIDEAVLHEIEAEAAVAFAPLHTPATLELIRGAQAHFPGLPQVACFDTSFHAGMPDVARVLPIPKALQREGLQRYGFHGLSCESIVHRLGRELPPRMVIAHLGNGASVTAVKDGQSIDTSMGLTPSGGVIMGTRSGDLDPGVLLYLMRNMKLDAAGIEQLVDRDSGLLGISGVSSDMRRLHAAAPSNADARLAIHMFCTSVCKQVAAMITVLDGVDLIVFTGGIGEHDAAVRAAVCRGLAWFGVRLDPTRNGCAVDPISAADSRCVVRVLASQEDAQIARHTARLLVQPPA